MSSTSYEKGRDTSKPACITVAHRKRFARPRAGLRRARQCKILAWIFPTPSDTGGAAMESSYQPIENYGVIGNMRTAALVGMNGSIDWLCLPNFDSPSVFAAILDDQKGGRFRIAPAGDHFRHKQFYWPDTNILITRFLHEDGIGELEDYMPVGTTGRLPDELIRRLRVVRGKLSFHVECGPAFDYARTPAEVHLGKH